MIVVGCISGRKGKWHPPTQKLLELKIALAGRKFAKFKSHWCRLAPVDRSIEGKDVLIISIHRRKVAAVTKRMQKGADLDSFKSHIFS